jgi:hypothetical protein
MIIIFTDFQDQLALQEYQEIPTDHLYHRDQIYYSDHHRYMSTDISHHSIVDIWTSPSGVQSLIDSYQ